MRKILLFLSVFLYILVGMRSVFAGDPNTLQLTFNPIRTELTVTPGSSQTSSMTFYNNSNEVFSFVPSAENCTVTNNIGTPDCTINAPKATSIESLASWIHFTSTGTVTIPPHSNITLRYTIDPPSNATPGGHYGAVLLNTAIHSGGTIALNRRTGPLLLITVPGNVIVDPQIGNIQVTTGPGGYGDIPTIGSSFPSIIELWSASETGSLMDTTLSFGKHITQSISTPAVQKSIIDFLNPRWETPISTPTNNSLVSSLNIPIENKGNIHIKPTGKVTLVDEDGTILKHIGSESIKNENGAIVGDRIIDFLPINEVEGNVLPGMQRTFTIDWKGFAYQNMGNISYEDPGSYYSRLTKENSTFLYPWEKLTLKHTKKTLTVRVEISYIDPISKKSVDSTQKIPVTIEYDEVSKVPNSGLIILAILISLIWFLRRRRKNRLIKESVIKPHQKRIVKKSPTEEIQILEQAQHEIKNQSKKVSKQKVIAATDTEQITPKTRKSPVKIPDTPVKVRKPRIKKTTEENKETLQE